MIRVLELFAGIGACSKALERLGIEHEIVDAVEIDKYAVKSFNAVHGTNFEPQDITKWDKDIEVDLIMHGSPCQDFSVAGKQAGGDEGSGTRSSLLYETLRIVEKLQPKYVIWENVKNLLSKKHIYNWEKYCNRMNEFGYNNWCKVMNAKDYGVPQNRERVFTVSIRKDVFDEEFKFPAKRPLTRHLKDVLESEVDEKYYLSDQQVAGFVRTTEKLYQGAKTRDKIELAGKLDIKGQDQIKRVYKVDGVSPTLSTMGGGNRQPKVLEAIVMASRGRNPENPSGRTTGAPTVQRLEPKFDGTSNTITSVQKDNYVAIKTANTKGYDLATDGDGIDLAYPDSKTRRGRVGHGVAKTIMTSDLMGVVLKSKDKRLKSLVEKTTFEEGKVLNMDLYNQTTNEDISQTLTDPCHNSQRLYDGYRIRKLTPKETWRLMGFDDADFCKAERVNSDTQLYKQAGNSIVVNVLEEILKELLCR